VRRHASAYKASITAAPVSNATMYPKHALSVHIMLAFPHSAPWIAPIRSKGAAGANHDHRWVPRKSKLHANDFEAISAMRTMVLFNSGQFHRIVLTL
jgi:hypothetical protein